MKIVSFLGMAALVSLAPMAARADSFVEVPAAPAAAQSASRLEDGFQLQLNLVDKTFPLDGAFNLTVPLRAGYHFGNSTLMLGAYLVRGSESSSFTGSTTSPSESALWLELAPTYRYYFGKEGSLGLRPYVQVEFDYALVTESESDSTSTSTTPKVFGGAAAFGAEYLFGKHFGVHGDIVLRYLHASTTSSSGDSTESEDLLAVGGTAGVDFHF